MFVGPSNLNITFGLPRCIFCQHRKCILRLFTNCNCIYTLIRDCMVITNFREKLCVGVFNQQKNVFVI